MIKHLKSQVLTWASDYEREGGHGLIVEMLMEYASMLPEDYDLPFMAPDWSTAPAWAKFWAVDFDGLANWFSHEPKASMGRWCYQQRRGREHLYANKYAVDFKKLKAIGREKWWESTLVSKPKEQGGAA